MSVLVSDLDPDVSEPQLREAFGEFGPIKDISIDRAKSAAIVTCLRQSSIINILSYPPLLKGQVAKLSIHEAEAQTGEVREGSREGVVREGESSLQDGPQPSPYMGEPISPFLSQNNSGHEIPSFSPGAPGAAPFASSQPSSLNSLVSNGSQSHGSQSHLDAPRGTKVFVGGLQCSQEQFERYWHQLDGVIHVTMIKTQDTRQSRGFGFVVFDSAARVELVLQMQHCIGGRIVDCKLAIPRHELPPSSYAMNNFMSNSSGRNKFHLNSPNVNGILSSHDPFLTFLEAEADHLKNSISSHRAEIAKLEARHRLTTNIIRIKSASHSQYSSKRQHQQPQYQSSNQSDALMRQMQQLLIQQQMQQQMQQFNPHS